MRTVEEQIAEFRLEQAKAFYQQTKFINSRANKILNELAIAVEKINSNLLIVNFYKCTKDKITLLGQKKISAIPDRRTRIDWSGQLFKIDDIKYIADSNEYNVYLCRV